MFLRFVHHGPERGSPAAPRGPPAPGAVALVAGVAAVRGCRVVAATRVRDVGRPP